MRRASFRDVRQEHALFEGVRDESENLLAFIQQQHNSQVPQPLVGKPWTGDEFEAFHLAEVSLGPKHVDIEEFCYIVVAHIRVFLPERRPDCGRFLLDECSLICYGLRARLVIVTVRRVEIRPYLTGSDALDEGCPWRTSTTAKNSRRVENTL